MCKNIDIIKDKLMYNILMYNNELFELENDIKRVNTKIKYYKNVIYNSILKSSEYRELIKNIKYTSQYNFLIKVKNKNLYRKNINTNRLKKISDIKI
jgi:hypothetical protein